MRTMPNPPLPRGGASDTWNEDVNRPWFPRRGCKNDGARAEVGVGAMRAVEVEVGDSTDDITVLVLGIMFTVLLLLFMRVVAMVVVLVLVL